MSGNNNNNDRFGGSMEELNSKYTKLASEYSKIRAQYTVMKRAVIDEKSKTEELRESVKAKDTSIRKIEAEMDSLKFRNLQLTKRVEMLQDEEASKMDPTRDYNDDNDVVVEELRLKILENERLQSNLAEIESRYSEKIANYLSRIEELESKSRKQTEQDRSSESKYIDLINGLKAEKVELHTQIKNLQNEVIDRSDRIAVLQVQLESVKANPPPTSSTTIANSSNLKSPLSFPISSTDVHVQTLELLSGIGEQIHEFVAASSDFHTYWEHISSSEELSKILHRNVDDLRPIEMTFQSLLAKALNGENRYRESVKEFADAFQRYVRYFAEVQSLMASELDLNGIDDVAKLRNSSLISAFRSYESALSRIAQDIICFGDESEFRLEHVENITVSLSRLYGEALELSRNFSAKVEVENTWNRTATQNIATSLSHLTTGLNAFSRILSDNLQRIGILLQSQVETPESQSEFSLKEKNKNLEEIIDKLNESLKKTQQSVEHWKLEFQLLQMKYEKSNAGSSSSLSSSEIADDSYFDEIKKTYRSRIDELVSEKLLADSKAASFFLECVSLDKRAKAAEERRRKLENDFTQSQQERERLLEEMSTTTSSYETQLSTMSEHLAYMNDKLSSQTDEITNLKYEMSNKKSKGKK